MSSTLKSFTEGDLVISVVGDGDGSGTYTDNQASPITLEEITTTGEVVGTMVLPQTTTVVDGVTEYAVSGEYGSSSEGELQLSQDGESLVIGGYGINAATYNAGGAAVYGDARLAQSTSLTGTSYTAVPRVVADISYDGTVDTSTALYGVFNTNNIRSVATVDGTSFYITGQGVKGDTTQGVFYADDGASVATAIDTSTDTRVTEIVNGVLYVSRDSTQGSGGTSNIASYGTTLPVSATQSEVLPAIDGSVTLTAAEENSLNASAVGTTVSLSPESYFFASPTVLYVADSGNPKAGGVGDGGLQKWTYNGTAWTLDYTLSVGLNLVSNTSTSGTTGLIGLTGEVEGDDVVLYATNATIGDLDQTYLFTITDDLDATTAPADESFTTLVTAAADTNIRGVSFAPTDTSTASAVTVANGGTSTSATISNGGSIVVQSGGTATGASILSGGSATISAGGSASGGVLAHGATETVLGSVSGTQIDGTQIVSAAGASVSDETVYNGGSVALAIKGAQASGITLNNGGILSIDGNAAATDTTILSGGTIELESAKATLSGTVLFSGQGTLQIDSIASSGYGTLATISGFGAADVIDDRVMGTGTTLNTTVSGGNTIATLSSGSVSQQFTFAGSALAASLTLSADSTDGVELTTSSAASSGSDSSNVVSSGATLSGAVVSSGDTLTVSAGGTIVGATVLSGGMLDVAGTDSGSVISAGGVENITGHASGGTVYGTQTLATSGASISNETVLSGGTVDITIKGVTATGITLDGGSLSIDGNSVANNTVLKDGGTLDLLSPKASVTGSLEFAGAGTLIQSVAPSSTAYGVQAVISGFEADDTIDLEGMGSAATLSSVTSGGNTLVTVMDGKTSETLTFAGDYAADFFVLGADSAGGLTVTAEGTPCYCPGTAILTETGERPVETLEIGDRLITRNGAIRPIRWIGRRAYDGRFAAGRSDIMPVRIAAGALGEGLPRRDLVISPLHAMFLDGVLVPVHALVNNRTITQAEQVDVVEYIHIELETHDIIFAEGAASETFIDDGSRGMFHNAREYAELYPDAEPVAARYCAPRVESGEELEAIRRRLDAASPRTDTSSIELYVDLATRGRVAGWARDTLRPHSRLRLRIRTNELVLCEVTADRHRADLQAAGKGDGFHAFDIDLIGGLSEEQLAALVVEPVPDARPVRLAA
ncbi:Hint domain-containing protein [Gluconobacter oxydans]|uniref:Hint domain-containing protein n=1 Tax=Gluconobacter oxydans DSM 3504 TaxID=1288313 RepID=A0A067Z2J5_GLUOY|nr:Hint domain-containing protein [Gluconobacter oxydans]AHK70464.1 Hint domain-containing protein [Gluconobacter oxydans DSM 3504]